VFVRYADNGLSSRDSHLTFRNRTMGKMALRGSFALIPTGPSLLDHLVNFETYADLDNCNGTCPPRDFISRPWPFSSLYFLVDTTSNLCLDRFPEGSTDREKTLRDHAVDALAHSRSLIAYPLVLNESQSSPTTQEAYSHVADPVEIALPYHLEPSIITRYAARRRLYVPS
jgi:hypothetical protein